MYRVSKFISQEHIQIHMNTTHCNILWAFTRNEITFY